MNKDAFEWDPAKAARNVEIHRIPFEIARDVFDDPLHIEEPDESEHYGEERYNTIGMVKAVCSWSLTHFAEPKFG